jgi:Peptidase M15
MTITIEFTATSYLRREAKQVAELPKEELFTIAKGKRVTVLAYTQEIGKFLKVTFADTFNGRNTWIVYGEDIRMHGTEPENKPRDDRPSILLPGYESRFYLDAPILPGGHFTWGEATHGGTRIPESFDIVNGIGTIARAMEEVKAIYGGKTIYVNSWYRDPATNRAIGGASQSRHLSGDAVDFVVDGVHPYDVFDRLDSWWGDQGGLASASCFVHLDARGYFARWNYGF